MQPAKQAGCHALAPDGCRGTAIALQRLSLRAMRHDTAHDISSNTTDTPTAALRRFADVNAVAAGFLRDLAYAQTSEPKMFGYKRAAAAVLALEEPLTNLTGPGRSLARIPGIGPASERVLLEV